LFDCGHHTEKGIYIKKYVHPEEGSILTRLVWDHETMPHWEELKKQDACGKEKMGEDMMTDLKYFEGCQEENFPGAGRQKFMTKGGDHKWCQ
jgi:hypothetical protein